MTTRAFSRQSAAASVLTFLAVLVAACAHTPTNQLKSFPTESTPVTRLTQLDLITGTDCVVRMTSGEVVRGRLAEVNADEIVLNVRQADGSTERQRVPETQLASVGPVVGRSKPDRWWIGFAIGAAASLPFSMSITGDAMLLGGVIGGWLGRSTGDSRIEIVLQR